MSYLVLAATVGSEVLKRRNKKKAAEKAARKAAKKKRDQQPQVLQPTRAPGTRNLTIGLGLAAAYLLATRGSS